MWHQSHNKDVALIGHIKDCGWILFVWFSLLFFAATPARAEADPRLKRCPPLAPRSPYLKAAPTWDTCYEFRLEKRDWRSAHITCLEKQGRLVTIREKRVQTFLVATMYGMRLSHREVWIGANDKRKEMKWLWVTGEDVDSGYTNWARGQPSCGITCFEDCAIMKWREAGGRWHDYHCSWFKNMPYICEYDMIPEPKTTTTTTTTTTATSTTTSATTPSTSPARPIPTKALESEYLVHLAPPAERTENTTVVLVPEQVVLGSDSAHFGSEKEQVHSSSFGAESITFLIVGLLIGLGAGFCIFAFLFVRRRRRHKQREEDPSVSYSNPYYGEVTAKVVDSPERCSDRGHLLDSDLGDAAGACAGAMEARHQGKIWSGGKIREYSEEEEMMLGAEGGSGGTHGGKNLKVPPPRSPLHQRPQYVMNTYDCPPCLATAKSGASPAKDGSSKVYSHTMSKHGANLLKSSSLQAPKRSKASRLRASQCSTKDGNAYGNSSVAAQENQYDELGASVFSSPTPPLPPTSRPPVPPLPVSYDVPRSTYKNSAKGRQKGLDAASRSLAAGAIAAPNRPYSEENNQTQHSLDDGSNAGTFYANFDKEENLYESVENLRAAIEHERHSIGDSMMAGDPSLLDSDAVSDDEFANENHGAPADIYVASSRRQGNEEEERYVPFPGDDTYA